MITFCMTAVYDSVLRQLRIKFILALFKHDKCLVIIVIIKINNNDNNNNNNNNSKLAKGFQKNQ